MTFDQRTAGGAGGIIDTSSTIQTPETVTPLPGQVAMGRPPGDVASAVHLSSTGQLVYPNTSGVTVVSARDAEVLKSAGWVPATNVMAVLPPAGPAPSGAPSTLTTNVGGGVAAVYSASAGWYPRAQVVAGQIAVLSGAPAGTSAANVPMALIVNGTTIVSGATDANGNYSLSTASLPTHDPIVRTVLTVQANELAVAVTTATQ